MRGDGGRTRRRGSASLRASPRGSARGREQGPVIRSAQWALHLYLHCIAFALRVRASRDQRARRVALKRGALCIGPRRAAGVCRVIALQRCGAPGALARGALHECLARMAPARRFGACALYSVSMRYFEALFCVLRCMKLWTRYLGRMKSRREATWCVAGGACVVRAWRMPGACVASWPGQSAWRVVHARCVHGQLARTECMDPGGLGAGVSWYSNF